VVNNDTKNGSNYLLLAYAYFSHHLSNSTAIICRLLILTKNLICLFDTKMRVTKKAVAIVQNRPWIFSFETLFDWHL